MLLYLTAGSSFVTMYTRCIVSAAGNVQCKCAPDRFDANYPNGLLVGGEKGYCACPPGQYVRDGRCFQCEIGTYRNSSTSQYNPCVHCGSMFTKEVGSTSEDNCTQNPIVLQNEISERDRQAQEQKKIYYISISCAVGVVGLAIAFGCYVHRQHQERHAIEIALFEAEMKLQVAAHAVAAHPMYNALWVQGEEISYLKNWHIKESEITLEHEIGEGSQGSVYLGRLRTRPGKVAIKVSTEPVFDQEPVWKEAEVAFMVIDCARLFVPRLILCVFADVDATPKVNCCACS